MDNYIYRKANIDDLDKVLELGKLIDEFELDDAKIFWTYDILKDCINNPDSGSIFCSFDEDNLAGFCVTLYNPIFKIATMSDLFVLPKYRNSGIGANLYKLVEEDAKSKNLDQIQITTEFNNTSIINFLENKGFDKSNNNTILYLKF